MHVLAHLIKCWYSDWFVASNTFVSLSCTASGFVVEVVEASINITTAHTWG